MSDGLGRGGTTSKRSPPRQAEDRDSTVVLRSTRGTGLPPRILSSGRGRGAGRGGGMRAWPVVRPQSGSVPPWANRSKTVDTYISSRPSFIDEGRVEAGSGYLSRKEPPTQPKWDRERSRTPLQHPRMMSSSPPSGSRPNTGATSGYSAGPSHQIWMAPEDQAGPSRYSVPEPQEEREPVIESGPSSPSTSRTQSQSNPNPSATTNAVHKSSRSDKELDPDKAGYLSGVKTQPNEPVDTNMETVQDGKEDMQMDTPGAGPSRSPEPAKEAESPGKDVKPDLSTLESEEIPSIADEDRQDGVLAVKRSLVLQCYEKNVAIRTAARKAFRVHKTAELAAVGRIVQHVLWRDDGVGVQWIRARTSKSPKKAATAPTETTPRISISIEPSPSRRLPATPLDQLSRPTTPPLVQPPSPKRPNLTPPIAIKPQPSASVFPLPAQTSHHSLPPKPVVQPSSSTVQPDAGPSGTSHIEPNPVRLPDEDRPLTKGQKKRAYEKKCGEIKKRKADGESLADWSNKPPKLPKVEQGNAAPGSAEEQTLTKKERKALNRRLEQERQEEIALNGTVGTGEDPSKNGGASKKTAKRHERKKFEKARARDKEEKAKRKETHDLTRAGKSAATSGPVSKSATAVSLGAGSSSAAHPEGKGKGKEKAANNPADKNTVKAKRVIDLSDDTVINGPANEVPKDKSKGKAREIVDLTRDSSNDKPNPPSARNPAKTTNTSSTAPKPAAIPARPAASSSTSRLAGPIGPTVRPSTVRPPIPTPTSFRPTAPARPSVRPPTTASVRPSASNVIPRPLSFNSSAARPPPHPPIGRPPPSTSVARPPVSTSSAARPPSGALGRPPQPRTISLRIPSDSSDITRPTAHPQYQAPLGQSSYSERQALAALARPPIGQPVRPAGTKFLPRPAATIQARPVAPAALSGVRPSASTDANQTRSLHRSSTLSSSSPLGGSEMLPSRSLTPAVTTPRYKELRRLLSEKMEEMDNWTSMLVDLPDRAEMTKRQIDRTRQECFVLQKQMRDEKDKAGS